MCLLACLFLVQLETGDLADLNTSNNEQQQAIPSDVRLIIQELQSSRQKERELRAQVDALQAEQKLASERLALYAVLALKLKRELINERLAHIDSKKETVEARAHKQHHHDSGDEAADNPRRRSSLESPPPNADEDDPWSSPNKAPGSTATAGSKLLSFTSFYHSSRATEGGGGSESEPPSPMSSTGGGLQPLRSSLIGQFLPSSLLDSPQITPSSRASATSSTRSFGRKDDTSASSATGRLTFEAEIKEGLDAFTLSEPPCTQCRQHPVSECAPCGHRLCVSCEASMLARQDFELTCPRCRAKVSSVKELTSRKGREEDNQLDHFLEGDVSSFTGPKQQSGISGGSAATVSPITLSLLAELFDSIPVEQLETALKESSGQASLAIEKILHTHPSFNPGFATSGGATSGGGGGSTTSESPIAPSHKASTLHRSSSMTGASSNQERTGGSGGGTSSASSNWKTEMCMYYLQGKCNKTRRTCSFAHGESDLVRNTNTQSKHPAAGAGFKSRMCPLYLEGICPKSRRDCPLAHGESDLRDGALGMASSSGASLSLPAAAPRLQSYKTELCYYYLKGCCNYTKEECRFAHGEGDLRTVESNTMEWSQKLGGGGGLGGGMGGGEYPSGPGSVSSAPSGAGGGGPPGLSLDKQLQHQQQYQQQFQPQSQYQSQQLQQLQPAQQPPQAPPGQQQLQHGSPAFPPPPHQLGALPHQFSPYHQQLPPQHQHMPPPHLPAMHHQQQQSMYHGNAPAQAHQFRYLKSMEDAAKRGGARPPPQPRRDTSSWSGYEPSGGEGDF